MTDPEHVFVNSQDAYDALQNKYDTLVLEYEILYKALMGDLDEAKRIKNHLIARYQKEINDLSTREESIKQAKSRAL